MPVKSISLECPSSKMSANFSSCWSDAMNEFKTLVVRSQGPGMSKNQWIIYKILFETRFIQLFLFHVLTNPKILECPEIRDILYWLQSSADISNNSFFPWCTQSCTLNDAGTFSNVVSAKKYKVHSILDRKCPGPQLLLSWTYPQNLYSNKNVSNTVLAVWRNQVLQYLLMSWNVLQYLLPE